MCGNAMLAAAILSKSDFPKQRGIIKTLLSQKGAIENF